MRTDSDANCATGRAVDGDGVVEPADAGGVIDFDQARRCVATDDTAAVVVCDEAAVGA